MSKATTKATQAEAVTQAAPEPELHGIERFHALPDESVFIGSSGLAHINAAMLAKMVATAHSTWNLPCSMVMAPIFGVYSSHAKRTVREAKPGNLSWHVIRKPSFLTMCRNWTICQLASGYSPGPAGRRDSTSALHSETLTSSAGVSSAKPMQSAISCKGTTQNATAQNKTKQSKTRLAPGFSAIIPA